MIQILSSTNGLLVPREENHVIHFENSVPTKQSTQSWITCGYEPADGL